ncbi:peptidoglycan-binding protein [Pseudomonas stutzeri]|nr:peptidoglycan-binding protein [Stutzerimonas stutzeri]
MAVRSLFARWQIAVEEPSALEEACERVARLDLHCLSLGDGLASLRRFNSPAILELRQADGPGFLATLLGLEQDRAQLSIAGRPREVAVDSLVRQWNGRYTLLWRAPEGWRGGLGEGAQDPAVAWVDQRLARWEGRAPRGGDRFDAQLAARVRDFQRAHGLRTDGVVGRETLARLAALTDPEAPALAQRTH